MKCSGGVQFAAQIVSNYVYMISKMVFFLTLMPNV